MTRNWINEIIFFLKTIELLIISTTDVLSLFTLIVLGEQKKSEPEGFNLWLEQAGD